ncbi:isoaspartyl peptidase/L-asparaginase family protein [Neotamlana laminarinivorans]|uniref:Isoaspartyl peptidase n=1 Tax=Neotamlana laminarinivorans TaxID=2883124 RepID=A0A9X1I1A3_9FLAO|nr:isoaspartyl peptidase/L-asparaginase [Tamlana laminarinivorans]MCB4798159.1 isoaspartyl peptidase/L-asparaginase [Tamlana laminarinivorans]
MKLIKPFLIIVLFIFSCKTDTKHLNKDVNIPEPKVEFSIAIHGGAGTIKPENLSEEKRVAYEQKLEEAILVGYNILKKGGTSLDAVQNTINVLEDSPLFNAGKGAVYTHDEYNEHDASIMDGKTLNAGASTGTRTVKNPINLARIVMDKSPHVMLSGKGAEIFATEHGLNIVEPSYFATKSRLESLKRIKNNEVSTFYNEDIKNSKFGTVGCVALDKHGNLAAGTSSGGMTNKRWGRIGDSPIIGAGTYANNNTCAVSCTGWGEYFIRGMVAHDISALMDYKNLSLEEASKIVIQEKLPNIGNKKGSGGIIAVDKLGNISFQFNTAGMYRASINSEGKLYVGIFKND